MDDTAPLVTIAMPVKNRAWCIEKVLRSVESQDYPKQSLQLIFVDGFSNDGTYEKLLDWAEERRPAYLDMLILRDEGNIPCARNVCLKEFKGNYLLWWDSDVVAPSEGVRRLLELFKRRKVGIAGLPYDVDHPHLFDRVYRAREPKEPEPVEAVGMGFTMVSEEAIKSVGAFNERLGGNEDTEYCLRARRIGYAVILDPTLRCRHLRPEVYFTTREYTEKKGKFNYLGFLRYEFADAPNYVVEFVGSGSKKHLAKIGYYLALPFVLIAGLAVSILTASTWMIIATLLYMSLSVAYHIRKTHGVFYGLLASAIFIPSGVALAYGTLRLKLNNALRLTG
jgi:glycosyltransferase involved in cell wall biosynthesis